MADYGTIGHLLSEAYIERVRELHEAGMEPEKANVQAREEMIFAGKITEDAVTPGVRIRDGVVLSVDAEEPAPDTNNTASVV